MGKKNGEQRHGNLCIKITCILVLEGPGIQFHKSFTIFFSFFFFPPKIMMEIRELKL